jgi:hypothetical protein
MAEALAIIGLVSTIVQLIDFGSKIVKRLDEFQSSIDDVPKSFRDIKTVLPLLLDILKRTKDQAEADNVTGQALMQVVEGCYSQVKLLDDTLLKTLPKFGDSSWDRRKKAFSSVGQERKVQQITSTLRDYVWILTCHQTTGVSKLEPKPKAAAVWLVPFTRNAHFVGREEIFERLEKAFAVRDVSQPRAALCGLGGVG